MSAEVQVVVVADLLHNEDGDCLSDLLFATPRGSTEAKGCNGTCFVLASDTCFVSA